MLILKASDISDRQTTDNRNENKMYSHVTTHQTKHVNYLKIGAYYSINVINSL